MGQAVPTQHPAVVLRSHYKHVRTLLAIAMIAVVALTFAVVVLATEDSPAPGAASDVGVSAPGLRYDGGPDEGTRGATSSGAASTSAPATRYDGGPEEGSRGSSD